MNTNPTRDPAGDLDPGDPRIEVLSRAARTINVPPLDTAHVVHTAQVRRRRRRAAIGSALAVAVFATGTTVATGVFDSTPSRTLDAADTTTNPPAAQEGISEQELQQAAAALVLGSVEGTEAKKVATVTPNDDDTGLVVEVPADFLANADRKALVAGFEADAGVPVEVIASTAPVSQPLLVGGNSSLAVGATGPVFVNTHCGLRYARIDGRSWETPEIGNGSSPRSLGSEFFVAAVTRTADDVAVLRVPGLSEPVEFRPAAPNSNYVCR